jgi:hypothetical protein
VLLLAHLLLVLLYHLQPVRLLHDVVGHSLAQSLVGGVRYRQARLLDGHVDQTRQGFVPRRQIRTGVSLYHPLSLLVLLLRGRRWGPVGAVGRIILRLLVPPPQHLLRRDVVVHNDLPGTELLFDRVRRLAVLGVPSRLGRVLRHAPLVEKLVNPLLLYVRHVDRSALRDRPHLGLGRHLTQQPFVSGLLVDDGGAQRDRARLGVGRLGTGQFRLAPHRERGTLPLLVVAEVLAVDLLGRVFRVRRGRRLARLLDAQVQRLGFAGVLHGQHDQIVARVHLLLLLLLLVRGRRGDRRDGGPDQGGDQFGQGEIVPRRSLRVQAVLAHDRHFVRVVVEYRGDRGSHAARRRVLDLAAGVLHQLQLDHVQHQILDAERRRVLAQLAVVGDRRDGGGALVVVGGLGLVGRLRGRRVVVLLLGRVLGLVLDDRGTLGRARRVAGMSVPHRLLAAGGAGAALLFVGERGLAVTCGPTVTERSRQAPSILT